MPLFGRRLSGVKPLEQMEKSKSSEGSSGFTVLSQEEVAARKARREALEAAERDRAGRRSFGFSFPGKSKNRISAYEEDSGSSNRYISPVSLPFFFFASHWEPLLHSCTNRPGSTLL